MDKWKKYLLKELGEAYTGLSGKKKDDFGEGKDFIPYLNVFENYVIKVEKFGKVKIGKNENQNRVQYGDVFFTISSETLDEVGMASVLIDEVNEVYLNSFCFGYRLNDFSVLIPEFASYVFRSEEVRHSIRLFGQGSTRFNLLKKKLIDNLVVDLPPISEQTVIAEILSAVDRAIEQTEAIINKLQRIKTGLMQDLLTKGIDENGNIRSEETHDFKDSPLGRIPVEWGATSIGKHISFITDYRGRTPPCVNEGIPVISAENIGGEQVKEIIKYVTKGTYDQWTTRGFPEPNDVIFTTEAPVGEVAFMPGDRTYLLTRRVVALRPDTTILRKVFLFWYLLRAKQNGYWKRLTAGTTAPRIKKPDILGLQIPIPTPEEQDRIGNFLLNHSDLIQNSIQSKIKLQSLKTGLMQDLLTGRVRVTEFLKKRQAEVS